MNEGREHNLLLRDCVNYRDKALETVFNKKILNPVAPSNLKKRE